VPKDRWKACPKCQARVKQEGLKDEDELQSYFIKRIETFLNAKGKRLIGWDEILEGGLAPDATVMSWRGTSGGIAAAKAGHDVIMTPKHHSYFNYGYKGLPTMKAYSYDPIPEGLSPEQAKHILGAQACFWSHQIRTEAGVDRQLFPRLLATAEVTWSPKELRDANSFRTRVQAHFDRLNKLGVGYHRDPSVLKKDPSQPKRQPDKK